MNKEWQAKQKELYEADIVRRKNIIVEGIKSHRLISTTKKNELIQKLNAAIESSNLYDLISFCTDLQYGLFDLCDIEISSSDYIAWGKWIKEIELENFETMFEYKTTFDGTRYLDSEPVYFDGDIIITDPCYIIKDADTSDKPKWEDFHPYKSIYDYPDYNKETKESKQFRENAKKLDEADKKWRNEHPDDWEMCEYGENMEMLGINTYMTRDTLYGDWSCTTFDSDTKEPIGEFCADAGLVSVFLLDEVLKYNPNFDYHTDKKWTTTWIKNFRGTVQFVVVYTDGYYEDETEYHKKGEHWEDYSVEVVGHGVDKVTGKPINFVGKQTGF